MDHAPRKLRLWSLPTEITAMVFTLVRSNRDRKAVCLVNCQFRNVMAPVLWATLSSDLTVNEDRSIDTILDPSNGVLPHVRHLELRAAASYNHGISRRFRILLCALPKNALRSFVSHAVLDALTVEMLLQTQQRLKTLRLKISVPVASDEMHSLKAIYQARWIKSCLTQVEDLSVLSAPPPDQQGVACETMRFFISNCPKLTKAYVGFRNALEVYQLARDVFGYTPEPMSSNIKNLTRLTLYGINFTAQETTITLVKAMYLSTLRAFHLLVCHSAANFLTSLVARIRTEPCQIRELAFLARANDSNRTRQTRALESLLSLLPGVTEIYLNLGRCPFLDHRYIMHHGPTLRVLYIGASAGNGMRPYYSTVDLTSILNACRNLEQLALNFCAINLGAIHDLGLDFRLESDACVPPKTELEAFLDAIASLPALHTLRMLSLVDIDFGGLVTPVEYALGKISKKHSRPCQILMQHFSTQILRYLYRHGCGIRIFSAQPFVIAAEHERPMPDMNGHIWPVYNYLRSKIIDGRARNEVVATPIMDVGDVAPEATLAIRPNGFGELFT